MPAPERSHFRFLDRLRVRWAEVDLQQIVFNGHYLMYVDTAVSGYWRALAAPYHATMHRLGGDLYVRKALLEYEGSARYDDQLEIGLRCVHLGNSSIRMAAGIFRHGRCLVHGELVYVFADPASQSSRPVPEALRQWLQAFEAGEAMVTVQTVGGEPASGSEAWALLADEVRALRQQVFAEDLGAVDSGNVDSDDAQAIHAVARNRLGMVVACGRLVWDRAPASGEPRTGRIDRLATHPGVRGAGFGAQALQALLKASDAAGVQRLQLNAAPEVAGFFLRAGFTRAGDAVMEAGRAQWPLVRSAP